jgi:hypothetical protein
MSESRRGAEDAEGGIVARQHSASSAPLRLLSFAPIALAVTVLAERSIAGILAKTGHPAATLDDAYIHFQYARALAEGHPLRFQAGAPITSGATSALWPALLAPFWALGARGDALLWPAWFLSFAALAGLAWEALRLTERLAGRTAAMGAAAMTISFRALAWCAASGMEVVPFAWAIARASRRASEWAEAQPPERTSRRAGELVALAWTAACFRPEGAVTAMFVSVTLATFAREGRWRERALSLASASSVAVPPVVLLLLTGSARSSTAVVKLLPGNPYYSGAVLVAAVEENARILVDRLLNGEVWSAEFLPHHGAPLAMAGLGAVAVLGQKTRLRWRAGAVLLLALTMFAPCFYVTFLWNRLRYLWPFATGWIVGLACLSRVAGDLAGAVRPRWRALTGMACGVFAGLFASRLEWVLDDIASSASGIDRQQATLGRWAKDNLPVSARIGVNDTGAIAYFSDRPTFDVVGLTTKGEGRYWVAGAASRFEHYERLAAESPADLPTHFIVYPEWMAMPPVLGLPLHEATVTDATILGGQTMRAYVADWTNAGSGEQPWTLSGAVLDAVDVADLESESGHEYELLGARDGEEALHQGTSPAGVTVVDGGRTGRRLERFVAHLPPGAPARGIIRLEGSSRAEVSILVNGDPVASLDLEGDDWVERTFAVPADDARVRTPLEVRIVGGPVTTFHYWFVTPG